MTAPMAGPIGYVGTGAMGTAMVQRLLDAGYEVVVHNRTRSNAAAAKQAGAAWAPNPGAVVERSALVLSCLRDTRATEAVYLGEGGLLRADSVGRVFVEHGTFAPALAEHIAQAATERGAAFLAAPVSGGPEGARRGLLTIMVGGDADAVERARPVLEALAGRLTHVGGPAAGLKLKLVNQLLVSIHMAAAGEAVALLRKLGIDLGLANEVLGEGWAQSAMLARTLDLVATDRTANSGATIHGMAEVLDLVADLLADRDVSAPVFDAGKRTFAHAGHRGLGEADPACLYRVSEEPDDRSVCCTRIERHEMNKLNVPGGQLEYETTGEGEAVLLIHGAIASDALAPLMTAPALDGFHLIRYRRRAYAAGYDGPLPVSITDDARDALALLDHLGVDTATIAGYSHGALVGIELAHQAPERVRGHVFLEAGVAAELKSVEQAFAVFGPIVERYHAGDGTGAVDALSVSLFGEDYEPIVRRALGDAGVQRIRGEARPTFESDLPAGGGWRLADAAPSVTQPVLHVVGDTSDDTYLTTIGVPLGTESRQVVTDRFPQAREHVLPGVNHLMALADPDGVAAAIAGFVSELSAAPSSPTAR